VAAPALGLGKGGGQRMKAAVYDRYGPADVVHVSDVVRPVPRDNEALSVKLV
jgi:hypothetical protein